MVSKNNVLWYTSFFDCLNGNILLEQVQRTYVIDICPPFFRALIITGRMPISGFI